MKTSSFTRFGGQATYLKNLINLRYSVAFRLTIWYAGFFAISLLGTLLAFYMLRLHGSSGISHHALKELREAFRHYFGIPLLIIISLSAVIGWFMAKRALSGIEEVTRAAIDIKDGALERRVPITGHRNEIDRLAHAFNTMVDRVQNLIGQMKEITENIAHDLRSPLTRMRGIAEITLTGKDSNEERVSMAGTIIEECDRLLAMINDTLDISEAESGLMKPMSQNVDLIVLLRDICDLFQPFAEERDIRMIIETPESAPIMGDLKKLQRVFSNLIDNALKYTYRGGSIIVSVNVTRDASTVSIKDTGDGIPEEDLPHIFDRFFRGEKSRSTRGNGLGLSLAQAFVLIHGGTITAASKPGQGSQFTVTLPKNIIAYPFARTDEQKSVKLRMK